MIRKIVILRSSISTGCFLLAAMAEVSAQIQNAKIEIVEGQEPEPIKYNSYKRYIPDIPDISLKDVCYPIGIGNIKKKDRQQQQRYAANRHNFKKR